MKNAVRDITLYNYYRDTSPEEEHDTCSRLYISGVSVFCENGVNADKEGFSSSSVYTVRIPENSVKAKYAEPFEFDSLGDKEGYFTLREGDRIVLGMSGEKAPSRARLEELYGRNVLVITGVTDNRGKRAPHYKVMGK